MKVRGEFVDVNEQITLTIQFRNNDGVFIDTDSFPQISIVQPSGSILLHPTSVGVFREDVGQYAYVFTVPFNGPYGIYNDIWSSYVDGNYIESAFNFIVSHTQMPGINIDGQVKLGDDPGFKYSQDAIKNINKLIKSLRARLNSSGKSRAIINGNVQYVDCDIFSVEMLTTFLATALWDFNQVPHFTFFTFDDDNFVEQFGEILVEGATLQALASKALIERGREFSITDNSLNFNPPTVSEMLNTQYSSLLSSYNDKLKRIKESLPPAPKGLGVFTMNSSLNPAYARFRHLRQRRVV